MWRNSQMKLSSKYVFMLGKFLLRHLVALPLPAKFISKAISFLYPQVATLLFIMTPRNYPNDIWKHPTYRFDRLSASLVAATLSDRFFLPLILPCNKFK